MTTETGRIRDWRLLRAFRRLRRRCWKLLIWFVIASAVVVSIGRLVAPYADAFRPVVERFLARSLERPVRIDRIEASWPRLSPQITLLGLEVGTPENRLLNVDRARLEFKLYNLLRPGRNSFELIVLGLNLVLIQDEQGRWSWRLAGGGSFAEGWEQTISAGDVILRDSGIRIAPRGLPDLIWSVPQARLSRAADRLRVRLNALPEGGTGDLMEARLILHMPDSRLESLRGFASAPNIALSHLAFDSTAEGVADLRAQMQWWLQWNRRDGARFHGRMDLHSLARGGIAGRMSSRFELDGRWRQGELAVELNAREFGDGDEVLIDSLAYGTRGDRHAVVADRIELDYLHALLQPWLGFLEFWPDRLSGVATDLRLGMDANGALYAADGLLRELALGLDKPEFSLSLDDAALALDGDRMLIRPSGAASIELPELYPDPLSFDHLNGAIGLQRDRVTFNALAFEHPEMAAIVDGAVELGAGAPFLDLVVDTPRMSSQSPRRWLPDKGIGPNTRKWLDEALLAVGSASAVTTLFGDPRVWKRHVAPGAVNSRIAFSGLRLAYAKDWPVAEQVAGTVEFSGESMHAVADSGRVAGVTLRAPEVSFAEARNAEIQAHLTSVNSSADDLSRLAKALPLKGVDGALDQLQWRGAAAAEAQLWFPVKRREDWRLLGSILFQDAAMTVEEQGITLAGIAGELPFTRERLGPANLRATMLDESVEVTLESRFQPEFSLALQGRFPLRGLIPADWKSALPEIMDRLDGSALFDIGFARGDSATDTQGLEMRVTSSLVGVEMDLPAPLRKQPADRWASALRLPLNGAQRPVQFKIGDRLAGQWLRRSDKWQLALGLGETDADLASGENFVVAGRLPSLQIDQWIGLLPEIPVSGLQNNTGGDAAGLSGRLDVAVDDLRVQNTSLGPIELALAREGRYWRLNGSGERIEGSVRFPVSGVADRAIVADMARLIWPVSEADEPVPPSPPSRLDPRRVPAFDVVVRDLQWGALELGEFRLSSHRSNDGLEIEQVSSRRDGLELSGSGEWVNNGGEPLSRMRVRLTTADLGQTLNRAGFDMALQRGQSAIELQGRWPGSPLDLSLQRVEGSLDLVVTDGVIPEASPGAGRLLGLVSLNSIPRRLRLDFSDVFGDGLSFDRVAGHFELSGGAATTDDLRIDAPAAEVRMRGRTDLENRTYDQVFIVRPGVGSALPVIGALAGGPVGAAAGAALQQIFSRPLSGITEVRYSVTGSWRQPVIEPIAVEH